MNIEIKNMSILQKYDTVALYSMNIPNVSGYIVMDDENCMGFEIDFSHALDLFQNLVESTILKKAKIESKALHFMKKLAVDLAGSHNEISDILTAYYHDKEDYKKEDLPARFIKATIPNTNIVVEFDTLTTHVDYRDTSTIPSMWKTCTEYRYLRNSHTTEEKDEYDA